MLRIITDDSFDILWNNKEQLLLILSVQITGDIKSPYLNYDGKENALLFINPEFGIKLGMIMEPIRKTLYASKSILVIETKNKSIIKEFRVPIITKGVKNG